MLFFVFVIFAGCAVKCDDTGNNYYVIEMPEEDTPVKAMKKTFNVYWNVPTMQCKSKKIPFQNLYERYGIIQNDGDRFRGEKISILYDPGLFPALLKNESSGKLKFRNGGVPQEGNIQEHIDAFKITLEQSIPDENFKGIGIIDFESWRPTFRQNFGVLLPYKDVSYEIEKKKHWWWPKAWIQEEAQQRFQEAARAFMQTTLSLAKQLRPLAQWGYYGFPYCFNVAASNQGESCSRQVVRENNEVFWLWSESTALYPSVYSSKSLSSRQLVSLIRGRVKEAGRVRRRDTQILPYFWFRYRDGGFMTEMDLDTVLKTLYKSSASGFIIWGSSNDVNTVDKCNKLQKYLETVMGPAIARYTKNSQREEIETTTDEHAHETNINEPTDQLNKNGFSSTTSIPISSQPSRRYSNNSDSFVSSTEPNDQLDPEFHWVPPENYAHDIIIYVEEEFKKKSKYNSSNNEIVTEKNAKNISSNILIDMIMNGFSTINKEIEMESESEGDFTKYPDIIEKDVNLKSTESYPSKVSVELTTTKNINEFYIENSSSFKKLSTKNPLLETTEIQEILTSEDSLLSTFNSSNDVSKETKYTTVIHDFYDNVNIFPIKNYHLAKKENTEKKYDQLLDHNGTNTLETTQSNIQELMTTIKVYETADILTTEDAVLELSDVTTVREDFDKSYSNDEIAEKDILTTYIYDFTTDLAQSYNNDKEINSFVSSSEETFTETSTLLKVTSDTEETTEDYTSFTDDSVTQTDLLNLTTEMTLIEETNTPTYKMTEDDIISEENSSLSKNLDSFRTEEDFVSLVDESVTTTELYNDITEVIEIEDMNVDEIIANSTNIEEDMSTSFSITSTSIPDKVVVYVL